MVFGQQSLTKGRPLTIAIDATVADVPIDFTIDPVYVTFTRKTGTITRVQLKYVPGGAENDGELEDLDGTPTVVFRMSRDWTRGASLPAGTYQVDVDIGDPDGSTGYGGVIFKEFKVLPLADAQPFDEEA